MSASVIYFINITSMQLGLSGGFTNLPPEAILFLPPLLTQKNVYWVKWLNIVFYGTYSSVVFCFLNSFLF